MGNCGRFKYQIEKLKDPLRSEFTSGSVLFSSGLNIAEDNSNLFWDDTNNRLGIGINSGMPAQAGLSVSGEVDILHTSTENDDHAVEFLVDAAGFGDVRALDIEYETGAITSGEDEAAILVDINEFDAVGGDVFGLEVLATSGGADAIYGMKAGAVVAPILQESGTFANPTTGTNDTPSTDVPAMIDGSTGTNTTIFVADDDYILIGAAAPFTEIEFNIETPAPNPGIKPTFGYSIAGAHQFTTFSPTDGTNGFRNSGVIAWDAADLTAHAVNTDTGTYDIKITRTHAVAGSVSLFFAKTAATVVYKWDKNGDITCSSISTADTFTDNALIRGDGGGSGIQDSGVLLDDSDNLLIPIGGKVGLGLTGPQKDFHISSTVPTIRLSDSDATTDQEVATLIELYRGDNTSRVGYWGMASWSNDVMALATDYAAGELSLGTGSNVERLRISSTGRVTIPGNLEVEGYIFADSILESTLDSGVMVDGVLIKDGLTDGIDLAANAVTAAAGFTDNALLRGDGGGTGVQDSGWLLDDNDDALLPADAKIQFRDANQYIASNSANTLTFVSGVEFVFLVGGTVEAIIDANALIFSQGINNVGLDWSTASELDIEIDGTPEATFSAAGLDVVNLSKAETFESDVAGGTAPIVVASATVCANLNVDQVDGKHSTDLVLVNGSQELSADWDTGAFEVRAKTFRIDGGIPSGVASTVAISSDFSESVSGAAPTLGNIAAVKETGPAGAGQTGWLAIRAGVNLRWIPYWT